MSFVIVHPNGHFECVPFSNPPGTFGPSIDEKINMAVQGDVDLLVAEEFAVDAYYNPHAKERGCEKNVCFADRYYHQVHGSVVFCGYDESTGGKIGLTDEELGFLVRRISQKIFK